MNRFNRLRIRIIINVILLILTFLQHLINDASIMIVRPIVYSNCLCFVGFGAIQSNRFIFTKIYWCNLTYTVFLSMYHKNTMDVPWYVLDISFSHTIVFGHNMKYDGSTMAFGHLHKTICGMLTWRT